MWTIKAAEAIVGSLGEPSKMPGYAYGIPAANCQVGSALAKIPGSVCSKCYALKGRYAFSNVLTAQQKRLASLRDVRWTDAMVFLITKKCAKTPWFRWHDSGDLQGLWHLINIVEIANRCPQVSFWLPTRERKIVAQYTATMGSFPDNLTVRVSGTMIDGPAPTGATHTSTVVKSGDATCPAYTQGGVCGDCRRCWDPTVKNVAYKEH